MKLKYIGIALTSLGLAAAVASAPAQQDVRSSGAADSLRRDSADQPANSFSADVSSTQSGPFPSGSAEWTHSASSERNKLASQESVFAHEADQLKHNLERAQSDAQRSEIKTKLAENVGKQFDLRQKRHGLEIETLELQVKKLKELVRKRQEVREEIITRRVEQTLREADGLGW